MKRALLSLIFFALLIATANAQEKGVDQQNDRIRDGGINSGTKVDTGTGRGIDFGRGRTPAQPTIPNPYRLTGRRDVLIDAVKELMQERKLVLDESSSKADEGVFISQPFTFTRGAVVSEAELSRIAELPLTNSRGWTRGRYTLIVEVQPIDGTSSNISVNARVEGRTDGVTGAEWRTLRSTGTTEQEFLSALIEKVTGAPPRSQ